MIIKLESDHLAGEARKEALIAALHLACLTRSSFMAAEGSSWLRETHAREAHYSYFKELKHQCGENGIDVLKEILGKGYLL